MATRDELIKVLEQAGVPDRYGFVGGLRSRVADMLVDAVKKQTRAKVKEAMLKAIDLADKVGQEKKGPAVVKSDGNRNR